MKLIIHAGMLAGLLLVTFGLASVLAGGITQPGIIFMAFGMGATGKRAHGPRGGTATNPPPPAAAKPGRDRTQASQAAARQEAGPLDVRAMDRAHD